MAVSKRAAVKTPKVKSRRATSTGRATSVILQARVSDEFARELLEHDAVVLGLDGPSEVVREGLRLLHRRAQEQALIASYDEYYGAERAPLPTGVVPADIE